MAMQVVTEAKALPINAFVDNFTTKRSEACYQCRKLKRNDCTWRKQEWAIESPRNCCQDGFLDMDFEKLNLNNEAAMIKGGGKQDEGTADRIRNSHLEKEEEEAKQNGKESKNCTELPTEKPDKWFDRDASSDSDMDYTDTSFYTDEPEKYYLKNLMKSVFGVPSDDDEEEEDDDDDGVFGSPNFLKEIRDLKKKPLKERFDEEKLSPSNLLPSKGISDLPAKALREEIQLLTKNFLSLDYAGFSEFVKSNCGS